MIFCVWSCGVLVVMFFFFKQKTAYEMRISDWSSDVCSSDLDPIPQSSLDLEPVDEVPTRTMRQEKIVADWREQMLAQKTKWSIWFAQIGRASCRERVCQYV